MPISIEAKTQALLEMHRQRLLSESRLQKLDILKERGELEKYAPQLAAKLSNKELRLMEPSKPVEEEKGILDQVMPAVEKYIDMVTMPYRALGTGAELAATTATGALAEPVSGVAGLARTITAGPEEGAKTIEQIQQAMTYDPILDSTKKVLGSMGKAVQTAAQAPGIKETIETGKVFQEGVLKTAGPVAAAVTSTIPAAILELAGLKGSRAAKRAIMRKGLESSDVRNFYDETGMIKPEIKKQVEQTGLNMSDVSDILPEDIATARAPAMAKQIKQVESVVGERQRMAKLAQQFDPDLAKIKAFEELDVDYLPQYVAQNPTAKAVAENLKDIPGSLMADKERRISEQIAQRADDIITELGGQPERAIYEMDFRNKMQSAIDDMADEAGKYYNVVAKEIPEKTPVQPDKINAWLEKRIIGLGGGEIGKKRLESKIKSLRRMLEDDPVTYELLDRERRAIGDQLRGADTPFRNVNRKELSELYDALTDDQETAILRHGDKYLLQTYLTGKYMVATRKGIEKQMADVMGKKLQKDITQKMGNAMQQLAKGDLRQYDEAINVVPKYLDPQVKTGLVATALREGFNFGARKNKRFSIGGFGSWWESIKRNKNAYDRLKRDLGDEGMKRVELIASVNNDLKNTMALSVRTGRQLSTPALFDEVNNIAARLYGFGKEKAARVPGVGRFFEAAISTPKNARSMAADELLTDNKFKNILKQVASKPLDTPTKKANANQLIQNLKSFQNFKKTLPPAELQELGTVGAIGYLLGTGGNRQEQTP